MTGTLFEFNRNNYRQTHGVALGIKTAVSFANIYKAETETNPIQHKYQWNISLMMFPFFGAVTEKTQISIEETNKSLACVAWRFWLGEGRETARRLGREQLEKTYFSYFSNLFFSRLRRSFSRPSPLDLARFTREFFVATPLLRPARQNRHATQANPIPKIKSTAEIWNNEITFLDTIVFKGEHLTEKSIFIEHQIPL